MTSVFGYVAVSYRWSSPRHPPLQSSARSEAQMVALGGSLIPELSVPFYSTLQASSEIQVQQQQAKMWKHLKTDQDTQVCIS